MKKVIIESPYAGDIKANTAYAWEAIKHSLKLNEAPFASHLFYTAVLDDSDEKERDLGMLAGWYWMRSADLVAVYCDRGISRGMDQGIKCAEELSIPIEYRYIGEKE